MTDIVERLRSENSMHPYYGPPKIQMDAAAEIERLRADLEAADIAVSRLNGRAELQMLMRENNKLRACLVDIVTGQVVELPFIQALARAALSPTASPEMG
jgi:hypothetical protein